MTTTQNRSTPQCDGINIILSPIQTCTNCKAKLPLASAMRAVVRLQSQSGFPQPDIILLCRECGKEYTAQAAMDC